MGTLLIISTFVVTHGNPILVGIAHTTALYIGGNQVPSHFSPFVILLKYSEGHMTLYDALVHLLVQSCAVLSLVITRQF